MVRTFPFPPGSGRPHPAFSRRSAGFDVEPARFSGFPSVIPHPEPIAHPVYNTDRNHYDDMAVSAVVELQRLVGRPLTASEIRERARSVAQVTAHLVDGFMRLADEIEARDAHADTSISTAENAAEDEHAAVRDGNSKDIDALLSMVRTTWQRT